MDKIPEHKILEFRPNMMVDVRKEYNLEKPGQMDAAVDLLEQWVKKQAHFTKTDFSREYLERNIIFLKGSVERAKVQLDKLCTMKTSMPYFFDRMNAKTDFENIHDYFVDALLPKLTKDNYRVYFGKALRDGDTSNLFTLAFSFGTLLFEHLKLHDYCSGFIAILDYRDINIVQLVSYLNIMEINNFMKLITEGYQMRVKGIHLVTASKAVDLIVRIFKQAFSKKIADRIHVHSTVETLHDYVPKDLLPEELGGELKSVVEMNKDWTEHLSTEECLKELKDMREAKVNPKLRSGVEKSQDDLLGMPGSFRALVVD